MPYFSYLMPTELCVRGGSICVPGPQLGTNVNCNQAGSRKAEPYSEYTYNLFTYVRAKHLFCAYLISYLVSSLLE